MVELVMYMLVLINIQSSQNLHKQRWNQQWDIWLVSTIDPVPRVLLGLAAKTPHFGDESKTLMSHQKVQWEKS